MPGDSGWSRMAHPRPQWRRMTQRSVGRAAAAPFARGGAPHSGSDQLAAGVPPEHGWMTQPCGAVARAHGGGWTAGRAPPTRRVAGWRGIDHWAPAARAVPPTPRVGGGRRCASAHALVGAAAARPPLLSRRQAGGRASEQCSACRTIGDRRHRVGAGVASVAPARTPSRPRPPTARARTGRRRRPHAQ